MTSKLPSIEAAILAGGTSRRMGRDKAFLRLQGAEGPTVIETLVATLRPDYRPLRILATPSERLLRLGIPLQPDLRPGLGPLGGIHAALATARRELILVVACDLPFLDRQLLTGLARLLPGHDAVVPRPEGRPLPVCAVYSKRCLAPLASRLDRGELTAAAFLEDLAVRWVEGPELGRLDPEGIALFNLNTPEDYLRAQAIAAKRTRPRS